MGNTGLRYSDSLLDCKGNISNRTHISFVEVFQRHFINEIIARRPKQFKEHKGIHWLFFLYTGITEKSQFDCPLNMTIKLYL